MIPNSEERFAEADYEYNRRQFLKLERGKKRAFLLLGLSIVLNIICIICKIKWEIFTFSLVFGKLLCFLFISYTRRLYDVLVIVLLFIASAYYNMEGTEWNRQVYSVCDTWCKWFEFFCSIAAVALLKRKWLQNNSERLYDWEYWEHSHFLFLGVINCPFATI